MANQNLMRDRQLPLMKRYKEDPSAAWVDDVARTSWPPDDPLHTGVTVGPGETANVPVAVHTAVGGDSDGPVPGDLLCAALASCVDSTIRVVANRLEIPIRELSVIVEAGVDVRGTLGVDSSVPVGFQRFRADVALDCHAAVSDAKRTLLLRTAERCCIVLQTLKEGAEVELAIAREKEGRHAVA